MRCRIGSYFGDLADTFCHLATSAWMSCSCLLTSSLTARNGSMSAILQGQSAWPPPPLPPPPPALAGCEPRGPESLVTLQRTMLYGTARYLTDVPYCTVMVLLPHRYMHQVLLEYHGYQVLLEVPWLPGTYSSTRTSTMVSFTLLSIIYSSKTKQLYACIMNMIARG